MKLKANKKRLVRTIFCIVFLITFLSLLPDVTTVFYEERLKNDKLQTLKTTVIPEWIDVQLLEIDGKARSTIELSEINSIVVHYVGNPSTTAQQNRDYFNTEGVEVSSHFIVGLDGEIIQCIPLNEKSAASNWRNKDTISIEVCHPDKIGKFNDKTYNSLVKLVAWLCNLCEFNEENIIRHYDVTGKECPIYYVKNESEWDKFKEDVMKWTQIDDRKV